MDHYFLLFLHPLSSFELLHLDTHRYNCPLNLDESQKIEKRIEERLPPYITSQNYFLSLENNVITIFLRSHQLLRTAICATAIDTNR